MERHAGTIALANHRLLEEPGPRCGSRVRREFLTGEIAMIRPKALVSCVTAALVFLASCGSSGQAPVFPPENDTINASEQQVGERLFVETRFAEYFAAHMTGVNDPLGAGDPVVSQVLNSSTGVPMPGPFAGESIN